MKVVLCSILLFFPPNKLLNTKYRLSQKTMNFMVSLTRAYLHRTIALLSVMHAIDPGHDDLCHPKKACKLHSCIYERV